MTKIEPNYGALSIDTSIFKREGLVLESGLLKQLDQFAAGPVKVIISDIVDREIRKHLIAHTKTVQEAVTKALKSAGAHLLVNDAHIEDARSLLNSTEDEVAIVDRRLAAFYAATGAEVIDSATHVDVARLIQMYFDCGAPFELAGAKKSEFPDAFALLAVEDWARKNQVKVLVVSADKGWHAFGKQSDRIEVIDSLGEAMSRFQPFHAIDRIIEAVRRIISSGKHATLFEEIDRALANNLAQTHINTIAMSSHNFQCTELLATTSSHAFELDARGAPDLVPIRIEDDRVVLQLAVQVTSQVGGRFPLSIWNGPSRRYERFIEVVPTVETRYSRKILLTVSGDFSKDFDNLVIDEIQVLGNDLDVDFGDLDAEILHHL